MTFQYQPSFVILLPTFPQMAVFLKEGKKSAQMRVKNRQAVFSPLIMIEFTPIFNETFLKEIALWRLIPHKSPLI